MSTRVMRKGRDPLDILERMINKTTLTTQRATHNDIMDIGGTMINVYSDDSKEDRDRSIQEAVEAAEARATRELRAAIKRLQQQLTEEKHRALEKQKMYYERLAQRVGQQRDQAEEERVRELARKMEREKEEALRSQWEDCERLKQQAIDDVCNTIRQSLRNELAIEKERAIADALRVARERAHQKEQESIAKTRREMQEAAKQQAMTGTRQHQLTLQERDEKYSELEQKYQKEIAFRSYVIKDFKELQSDYKRFMDYTGGQFHSDYLMRLRYLGMKLADKDVPSLQTYDSFYEEHRVT